MKKVIGLLSFAFILSVNVSKASNVEMDFGKNVIEVYDDVTPLCKAISDGDVSLVEKIIEYGIDLNGTTHRGMTPLMFAARYDNVEIIKLLVEKGADLKIKDKNGFAALDHAISSGAKKAELLIQEFLKK